MSLSVSSTGSGDFEMVRPGAYVARCYRILDLGTQTQTGNFGTTSKPKVMISWELLDQDSKMEDGRPFSIHKTYTASLNEKATLRADLEAWRNKKFSTEELENFDLKNVLGAYCQIQVVHSEDGKYANVQTIMSFKGTKPKGVNELVSFDIDEPDMEVFNALSDATKAKIMAAPEWKKDSTTEPVKPSNQVDDVVITDINEEEPINLDDIPF